MPFSHSLGWPSLTSMEMCHPSHFCSPQALLSHPDKNRDDASADERFRRVAAAYDQLSDDDKRARYDRGETELGDFDFQSASDLFNAQFSDVLMQRWQPGLTVSGFVLADGRRTSMTILPDGELSECTPVTVRLSDAGSLRRAMAGWSWVVAVCMRMGLICATASFPTQAQRRSTRAPPAARALCSCTCAPQPPCRAAAASTRSCFERCSVRYIW